MVGQRAVLLHFIQLGRFDDHQRVFLSVHHLGLQGGIDFAELQAGRRRAQGLEQRNAHRADRHADLHAIHVGGRLHRLGARGDLAEAVVPHFFQGMQTDLGEVGAHGVAQLAVHGLPDFGRIGKREADGRDGTDRGQGGDHHGAGIEHVDAAAADLRQHVGITAQLVVGEHLDRHAALAFLGHARGRFQGADMQRVAGRQVVAELEFVFRRGGTDETGQAHHRGSQRQARQGAQRTAAREVLGLSHVSVSCGGTVCRPRGPAMLKKRSVPYFRHGWESAAMRAPLLRHATRRSARSSPS